MLQSSSNLQHLTAVIVMKENILNMHFQEETVNFQTNMS